MAEAQVRALMALARAKAATQTDQRQRRDVLPILIAWFGSKAAIGATQLPAEILAALVAAGFNRLAAGMAGEITLKHSLPGRTRSGSPGRTSEMSAAQQVAAEEPEMRAEFLLASADRLSEAVDSGTLEAATVKEERYVAQHVAAGKNRRKAAQKLDGLAAKSDYLIWRTVMDKNTTPDCAALNNRVFLAAAPPGLPGAMHPKCRCTAEPTSGPLVNWGAITR